MRNLRREDVACRYGGEEFVLVLPEASLADAERRAEELRDEIKRLRVSDKGRLLGPLTTSFGVAAYPEHGLAGDMLLRAADTALYRAKREGRDRVVIAGGAPPPGSAAGARGQGPRVDATSGWAPRAGGGGGQGSRDPFPCDRLRTQRARTEPSRDGSCARVPRGPPSPAPHPHPPRRF